MALTDEGPWGCPGEEKTTQTGEAPGPACYMWFGERWGPACDYGLEVPVPVNWHCESTGCGQRIMPGDQGVIFPVADLSGHTMRCVRIHLDCWLTDLGIDVLGDLSALWESVERPAGRHRAEGPGHALDSSW